MGALSHTTKSRKLIQLGKNNRFFQFLADVVYLLTCGDEQ